MTKIDTYRQALAGLPDWDAYLLAESGLPGPRGNLELAAAVADAGDEPLFRRYVALDAGTAPANTPAEFLAFCGALGLGRLAAEAAGERRAALLADLRRLANDPRWRTREAVAMALQRLGDAHMEALLAAAEEWAGGTWLEARAAAAGVCEPRLLREPAHVRRVLAILDRITARVAGAAVRRGDDFKALRQGLGYCWSVAIVALPAEGKPAFERWAGSADPDVQWIVRENLKKARLARMDAGWVAALSAVGP